MKKILALILTLAMILPFAVACGDNSTTTSSSPPSGSASASGGAEASSSASASASTSPSTTANVAPPPVATIDPLQGGGAGSIGFVDDDVDPFARDSYHIVYYNFAASNLNAQIATSYEQMGPVYNYTTEFITANGDADTYINNLYTLLLRAPDGIITDIGSEQAPRVAEITREFNVPVVNLFSRTLDSDGHNLMPTVEMDQFQNGVSQMQWLFDNYTDYWDASITLDKVTALFMDLGNALDIHLRIAGAEQRWQETLGDQTYYIADCSPSGLSAQSGYDNANAIMSAHPEVEYWFIVSSVEDLALGTSRAVEALGLEDRVLISSSGFNILPQEWDNGYEGVWVVCCAIPAFLYAATALMGLLALVDGRATPETLWSDFIGPDDYAARLMIGPVMVDKPNYIQFLTEIMAAYGVYER